MADETELGKNIEINVMALFDCVVPSGLLIPVVEQQD